MSDIEDLRARAEELGVKVDGRWREAKLLEVISDAEAAGDSSTADYEADEDRVSRDFGGDSYDEPDEPTPAEEEAPQAAAAGPFDDWPKRIAPCAWLDQSGRRHTDLGSARAAVEALRGR